MRQVSGISRFCLRRGLTLLEVILALAIFAGSMAVLGELVRTGIRSAKDARDYTRAEIHAESIMSQVVAGAMQPGSVSNSPVPDDPNFVYSMSAGPVPTGQQGLLQIEVTVTRNVAMQQVPAEFTLVRWMVDPQMELNMATQAQANAQAAADAKAAAQTQAQQNSSTSSSSGGTSQGGQ
jgi:prepilin-type N-terminal cleavage/methylation domain-containing protein